MGAMADDLTGDASIERLPRAILCEIFQMLQVRDIFTARLVCKEWLLYIDEDVKWSKMLRREEVWILLQNGESQVVWCPRTDMYYPLTEAVTLPFSFFEQVATSRGLVLAECSVCSGDGQVTLFIGNPITNEWHSLGEKVTCGRSKGCWEEFLVYEDGSYTVTVSNPKGTHTYRVGKWISCSTVNMRVPPSNDDVYNCRWYTVENTSYCATISHENRVSVYANKELVTHKCLAGHCLEVDFIFIEHFLVCTGCEPTVFHLTTRTWIDCVEHKARVLICMVPSLCPVPTFHTRGSWNPWSYLKKRDDEIRGRIRALQVAQNKSRSDIKGLRSQLDDSQRLSEQLERQVIDLQTSMNKQITNILRTASRRKRRHS